MTSITSARDIMLADATNACVGLPIVYGDAPPAMLDGTANWARATIKHAGGGQQGLGTDTTKKYRRFGVLCVELFTVPGDGFTDQDALAEQILTYLENRRSSPIWYRNIRASEAGRDGGYNKINLYADFEYESNH